MRKEKQRNRTTRFFIDAASELIQRDGIQSITIRKVAEEAGYNSATLYNYFDNLTHLKSLAAQTFTFKYIHDLENIASQAIHSYELNYLIWECFYKHSYDQPDIFFSIFGEYNPKDRDGHIKNFFDIYPEKLEGIDQTVKQMLIGDTIYDRTLFLLRNCSKEGYFDEEDLESIDELIYFIYRGMMTKLINKIPYSKEEFVSKGMRYTHKILESFRLK